MTLIFTDQIYEVLHRRLKDLMEIGLFKIWFRVESKYVSNLHDYIGYRKEDLANILKYTGLSDVNGDLLLDQWSILLRFEIMIDTVNHRFGCERKRIKYIRFIGPISGSPLTPFKDD